MTRGTKPLSGITFLKTNDLEITSQFYIEQMGFDQVLDQGTCRIFKICENCYLGFCITEGDTGSDEVIYTIEIDDVDGYYEQLRRAGVDIEIPPRLNERYQICQMFARDPNGYLIEIQRFLDHRWGSE